MVRATGPLRTAINASMARLPIKPDFGITHFICIDEDGYLSALRKRLSSETCSLPEYTSVDEEAIAKQVIVSMMLAGRVSFAFQGTHSIDANKEHGKISYAPAGYINRSLYRMSHATAAALLHETGGWPALHPPKISAIALKLDRYFRSGMWWNDRISMALGYLWDALCTPSSQQTFLGLTNSLEALLSTQNNEITHILAERIAVLTEKDASMRLDVYKTVKELYGVRSKITHGKSFPKKGTQNWESLLVTARFSNVPLSLLRKLFDITLNVITAVISNRRLLLIIQPKRNEQKISNELDAYFAALLFA